LVTSEEPTLMMMRVDFCITEFMGAAVLISMLNNPGARCAAKSWLA
jgi:hypothetical protein